MYNTNNYIKKNRKRTFFNEPKQLCNLIICLFQIRDSIGFSLSYLGLPFFCLRKQNNFIPKQKIRSCTRGRLKYESNSEPVGKTFQIIIFVKFALLFSCNEA